MIIKTGLLHIPQLDEAASQAIGTLLGQSAAGCVITLERAAGSQRNWIEETLRQWSDEEELDLILTVGGCYPAPGPSAEEIAPEATLSVLERPMPGLAEHMRAVAQEEMPLALLDRGVAGIRGRTLIVNLPAGPGASMLFLDAIVELIEPICLHLQGSIDAPMIEDALDAGENSLTIEIDETPPEDESFSGLNADEFSAFLHRGEE